MSAKALMMMGTGSDVGKSLIVAGLTRAFTRRGLRVMPFKPQNMSNNAAVTADGGEIGRAQALQARAAELEPVTAMNPVLLKPEHETGAQVIVRGKRVGSMPAREYFAARGQYLEPVLEAFSELSASADLVLVEGAGSASEINLRHNDIANFGFARAADVPVVIAGDIARGGVIASLVGTFAVIEEEDAALVKATIVNRFQGDPSLFEEGRREIEKRTGRPCFGPIPFFEKAALLPAEDILGLQETTVKPGEEKQILIAVPRLPRIANFDDSDPLRAEPGVELVVVPPGQPLPREADLIIIPGSKSTRTDLAFLRQQGWDIDIKAHVRAGRPVLGICAGFQMLGETIADPDGLEGEAGTSKGLGLLQVETVLAPAKQLRVEQGTDTRFGAPLTGYHMHLGKTSGPDAERPFASVGGVSEGAVSPDGLVSGTYLHGLFAADDFRRGFLKELGANSAGTLNYEAQIEQVLDQLGEHLEQYLNLDALLALARGARLK